MKHLKQYDNNSNDIANIIIKVIDSFNYGAFQINHGSCGEFSDRLVEALGGETDTTFTITSQDIDVTEYSMNYEDTKDKRYYKKFGKIPSYLPISILRWVDHSWVHHNGKNYDAQTINGVKNFVDLTWFKLNMEEIIELNI